MSAFTAQTREKVVFAHPDFDQHEQVVYARDPESGLRAIIALHSTALGPAFGGCRMWPYRAEADALADVLRLSRGMTYKAAICNLPYGGGKAVIIGDPRTEKTEDLVRAMGHAVDALGGRYIIADDIGTNLADLAVMRAVTRHTAAATASAQQPLAVTAYGVLMAIRAAIEHRFQTTDLSGLRIAVQGLGNVGLPLCRYLHEADAELIVADMDPARVAEAERTCRATVASPSTIYDQPADLFAPCALGAILDAETVPRLKAKIVCGGANNHLAQLEIDALLASHGVLYIPDYVANAGGVIDFHQERSDDRPDAVMAAVGRIGGITADLLVSADRDGRTPLEIADRLVAERLAAARHHQAA